ncbi:alpha/beta fold hydrolase [Phytohabitans kaempferiae]|uniref:Alpha/beta fold hydrolase n=1 Tax=Phytohabitans kaempferiae TaxID=1620943 RepID=A0ABV6MAZ3_9ACTN
MPLLSVNGIQLRYDVSGTGEPVVLVAGTATSGRVWYLHQVPSLTSAGYQTITFDNRDLAGAGPTAGPVLVEDLVADTVELIERLELGAVRLVGFSLGARVAQEVALTRPDLLRCAVLMGTRGRLDRWTRALGLAEQELADAGVALPASFAAAFRAMQYLSRRTRADDRQTRDWLEIFELAAEANGGQPEPRRHVRFEQLAEDRIVAYRDIKVPCLVIAFGDDLVTPPHLGREVAEAIPGGRYREIPDCGHYGYLERPSEVNAALLDFLANG